MTGKVFNSSLLHSIGSKLRYSSEQIKFITQMLIKSAPPVTLKFDETQDEYGNSIKDIEDENKTEEDIEDESNLVLLNVTDYYR